MKYIFVFNLVVFNLKHTKIERCVFTCVYEGRVGGRKESTWKPRGRQPGKVWEPLLYAILFFS